MITSKDIQAQAKALKVLCTEKNKCEYEPSEELEAQSPKEYFGSSLANCAPLGGPDVTHTIGAKGTVKISDSVGLDVSTEFTAFKVFKTSTTIPYKHERTDSHESKEDVVVPVPPHFVGGVMVTQPVIRDIGDFTLNFGNTKWVLKGVFFDTPGTNPKRRGTTPPSITN